MPEYPLKDIRVMNFGWYWAGPVSGHLLGDMGADLITIESRKHITGTRFLAPFMHNRTDDVNYNFWAHNLYRSGLSLTLNLGNSKAKELFKEMISVSDVLIENFALGTLDRLGIGYQDLRKINPSLVVLSLSGAGQNGVLSHVPILGSSLGSLAGIDSLQGYAGELPTSPGTAVPDAINGVIGAFAVLAGLRERQRTGKGQQIDISQWEALTATIGAPLLDYWFNRRGYTPIGNRDAAMAPHGVYPCRHADSWVAIAVKTQEEWQRFCRALGSPEWAHSPAFADPFRRLRNQDQLDARIQEWTRTRTNYEATTLLQANGVAAFPSLGSKELFEDSHFLARESWVQIEHALGPETVYGIHWKLSETPGLVKPNHPLGTDNRSVYGTLLGHNLQDYATLEGEQVFF